MRRYDIGDLLELMRRLRDPQTGCPWDLKQDHASLLEHTLEEVYELADAVGDLGDEVVGDAFRAQVVPQPRVADARRARRDEGLGEARVGEQAGAFELVEHGVDVFPGSVGREFLGQFGAGMLASGEHFQRPAFQRAAQASAATAACCSATPTSARILFSISRAISGCSLRYSRALSLPWPMRSPL